MCLAFIAFFIFDGKYTNLSTVYIFVRNLVYDFTDTVHVLMLRLCFHSEKKLQITKIVSKILETKYK